MSAPALALVAHLAAGGVVDVGAGAEARGTNLASPDAGSGGALVSPGSQFGALVVTPSVSAAVEDETRALSASYAPQASFVAPQQVFLVLHSGNASGQLVVDRRLRLRGSLSGAAGDLDPSAAQAALQRTSAVLEDPLGSLPYAAGSASAGVGARLARTLQLDVDGRADTTQSPGLVTIPATTSGGVDGTLAWQLARVDAALVGVRARAGAIDGRGSFAGAVPVVGWRRQLGRDAGLDVAAGVGPYRVDAGDAGAVVVFLPSGEARLRGLFDLAGESALELSVGGSLGAVADPLGALLENRAAGSAGAVWRVTRELAVRAELGGFGPILTVGRPPNAIANASLTSTGGIAWTLTENLAVTGGLLGTTRFINDRVLTDVTLSVAMVGNTTVFHTGGRPVGSDRRLGRALGQPAVGAPPPPNEPLVDQAPPLEELELPEPPPAELAPPPGILPDAPPPPSSTSGSRLRDGTRDEKEKKNELLGADQKDEPGDGKKDDGKKDKKDDGKKDEDDDGVPESLRRDDGPASRELLDAPP